jgi:hypothetical protein
MLFAFLCQYCDIDSLFNQMQFYFTSTNTNLQLIIYLETHFMLWLKCFNFLVKLNVLIGIFLPFSNLYEMS